MLLVTQSQSFGRSEVLIFPSNADHFVRDDRIPKAEHNAL